MRRPSFRKHAIIIGVLTLLTLTGCAAPDADDDPLEPYNRAMDGFNVHFNDTVTLPLAWLYVYQLPGEARAGLHNVLTNLESPVTFSNDVLQGEFSKAGGTLARFAVNSTAGLGGFLDVAQNHLGLAPHEADFGQTLARYGVPAGPFLVLPITGPTTPRDLAGGLIDLGADPLFYLPADWTLLAHAGTATGVKTFEPFTDNAGAVYLRAQLARASVDPYASMRSAYRQRRQEQINGPGPKILPDWTE